MVLGASGQPVLGSHLLVVSPHCDDAVFSLGAALAVHRRRGGRVTVLTVLANDPESPVPASPWDAAAGFRTAGEAAAQRRAEDRAACRVIGARAVHLPGLDEQYRGEAPVTPTDTLLEVAATADEVLLPGHPLRHRDHRAVTDALLPVLVGRVPVRLYAEEPYVGWAPGAVDWPEADLVLPASPLALLTKVRSAACYRSQLALLGEPFAHRLRPGPALLLRLARGARRPGERLSARL